MKKIILFGAGFIGKLQIQKSYIRKDVVAVTDNNQSLWGTVFYDKPVISPSEIKNINYDYIIICVYEENIADEIKEQLISLGISADKILHFSYIENIIVCGNIKDRNQITIFNYERNENIIAYVDPEPSLWGTNYYGIPVISPKEVMNIPYFGLLIIGNDYNLYEMFIQMGIAKHHISKYSEYITIENKYSMYLSRCLWIRDYSEWINNLGLEGSVAECGVFRGEFAKFINEFFPNRKLYLFDTFEGFVEKDVRQEQKLNNTAFLNSGFNKVGCIKNTDIDIVMNKMNYPENVVIKKGYFPDSAKDIDDKFCFVNLDMDLYQPMLAGLNFFWDKMVDGGCMLIHDYFRAELNVSEAVSAFEKERNIKLHKTVIGDNYSLLILK